MLIGSTVPSKFQLEQSKNQWQIPRMWLLLTLAIPGVIWMIEMYPFQITLAHTTKCHSDIMSHENSSASVVSFRVYRYVEQYMWNEILLWTADAWMINTIFYCLTLTCFLLLINHWLSTLYIIRSKEYPHLKLKSLPLYPISAAWSQ